MSLSRNEDSAFTVGVCLILAVGVVLLGTFGRGCGIGDRLLETIGRG